MAMWHGQVTGMPIGAVFSGLLHAPHGVVGVGDGLGGGIEGDRRGKAQVLSSGEAQTLVPCLQMQVHVMLANRQYRGAKGLCRSKTGTLVPCQSMGVHAMLARYNL